MRHPFVYFYDADPPQLITGEPCDRRLRVKGLAETEAERERLLLQCLPRLGPTGESQRLPRDDLTRLFQQLGVSVRYLQDKDGIDFG